MRYLNSLEPRRNWVNNILSVLTLLVCKWILRCTMYMRMFNLKQLDNWESYTKKFGQLVCGTPCIYEDPGDFEISDHELDHEWIAMRFVNSNGFMFLECDHIVREVERRRPVCAWFSLMLIRFYQWNGVVAVLQSSDDHVDLPTWFPWGPFSVGGVWSGFRRTVPNAILYTGHIRDFACELFCR